MAEYPRHTTAAAHNNLVFLELGGLVIMYNAQHAQLSLYTVVRVVSLNNMPGGLGCVSLVGLELLSPHVLYAYGCVDTPYDT